MTTLISLGFVKILNHGDDLIENSRFGLLDVVHKLPKFFLLRTVDDKAVAVFEERIELFGEIGVGEEGMAKFEVAVMLVFSLLILPQKFNDIFVGLQILCFQTLEPSLSMLHIKLF